VQPGNKPEVVLRELQAQLDRIKTEGVTAAELNRAKRQFARDYILGRDTVQQKALHLAHAVVIHNDIKTADGEFDLFQNVTVADVQRVARTYFTPESRMLLTILPKAGTPSGGLPPRFEVPREGRR
jgi:zinc protease